MSVSVESLDLAFEECYNELSKLAKCDSLSPYVSQGFGELAGMMRRTACCIGLCDGADCFSDIRWQLIMCDKLNSKINEIILKTNKSLIDLKAELSNKTVICEDQTNSSKYIPWKSEVTQNADSSRHSLDEVDVTLRAGISNLFCVITNAHLQILQILPSSKLNYIEKFQAELRHATSNEIERRLDWYPKMDTIARAIIVKTKANLLQLRDIARALQIGLGLLLKTKTDPITDYRVRHVYGQTRLFISCLGTSAEEASHPFYDRRVYCNPEDAWFIIEEMHDVLNYLPGQVDYNEERVVKTVAVLARAIDHVYDNIPVVARKAYWRYLEEFLDYPEPSAAYIEKLRFVAGYMDEQDPIGARAASKIAKNQATFLMSLLWLCRRRIKRLASGQTQKTFRDLLHQCITQFERLLYCVISSDRNLRKARRFLKSYNLPLELRIRTKRTVSLVELPRIMKPLRHFSRMLHELMCSVVHEDGFAAAAQLVLDRVAGVMGQIYAAAPKLKMAVRVIVFEQMTYPRGNPTGPLGSLLHSIRKLRLIDPVFAEEGAYLLACKGYDPKRLLGNDASSD